MAMGREEVGFLGETAETHALERNDLACDGVFKRTRAQMAEAEMIRDTAYDGEIVHADVSRFGLLRAAEMATDEVLNGYGVTPLDDRLIVRYASHREGYVCTTCDGSGHGEYACSACNGTRNILKTDRFGKETSEVCIHCAVTGSEALFNDGILGQAKSTGFEPCSWCKGSGLQNGSIAIPDKNKQDHSYGDIVSAGAQVYDLRVGDRVLFSKMAGVYMKSGKQDRYKDDINYCLLRRGEVMGLMVKK